MIVESTRGKSLFNEVVVDFSKFLKKELKKQREQVRLPYIKSRKQITEILWHNFTCRSPKMNNWYVTTGLVGDPKKPKALNHYHITTNAGPGGSKLYIIYRGDKTAKKECGENAGGYIVSVQGHVLSRMRDRGPEEFKDLTYDQLCEKIFTADEEGVYYDFDWTKYSESASSIPTSIEENNVLKEYFKPRKIEVDQVPIILKTLSGIYLGFATKDRAEIRLKTYIAKPVSDEEEELISKFLTPAWICYNQKRFDEDYVKLTYDRLMLYMEGKDNRTVYRLGI